MSLVTRLGPYSSVVPAEECKGSPVEKWTDKGLEATVRLMVNWSDRTRIMEDILGKYLVYPRIPASWAVAATGQCEPWPDEQAKEDDLVVASTMTEYALVTINYHVLGVSSNTHEWLSESIEPNAEFLTLPPKLFTWDLGGTQKLDNQESPGLLLRTFDYVLTFYRAAQVPSACFTLPGCCNRDVFQSILMGGSFPAESLLFSPPKLDRKLKTGPNPQTYWTITYRFSCKPWGWNKFFNNATGSWSDVYCGGNLFKPYTPADFAGIFPVNIQ